VTRTQRAIESALPGRSGKTLIARAAVEAALAEGNVVHIFGANGYRRLYPARLPRVKSHRKGSAA